MRSRLLIITGLALLLIGGAAAGEGHARSKRFLVVLDAGHGGWDPGAKGYYGALEKNINLSIVKWIWILSQMDPDVEIVLTRQDDRYIELRDRTGLANKLNADLYVSVHSNAHPRSNVTHGVEVLVADNPQLPTHARNLALAKLLQKRISQKIGANDRGIRQQALYIRWAKMPAVLIEAGFLTNPMEELKLRHPSYQLAIAQSILDGLREYLTSQR
jgi:N-acetylmuramoyl-L-alanine amidase